VQLESLLHSVVTSWVSGMVELQCKVQLAILLHSFVNSWVSMWHGGMTLIGAISKSLLYTMVIDGYVQWWYESDGCN
jgi:hypothetical protein